jgi:hypothetical protein
MKILSVMGALLLMGILTTAVQAAEATKKMEIVIKEGEAKVIDGFTYAGTPTEIVVRNEDTVTHGFNSSLFLKNTTVKLVSGGSLAEGKGPNVFRVEPGKTMVLKVTKPSQVQEGIDSMTYAFWCDMHRGVKGEMLVVETTGESGG